MINKSVLRFESTTLYSHKPGLNITTELNKLIMTWLQTNIVVA